MAAPSPFQSALPAHGCSQHGCMLACAANALGTLIAQLAAMSPHSPPPHDIFLPPGLFSFDSHPSPSPEGSGRCAHATPPSPPRATHLVQTTFVEQRPSNVTPSDPNCYPVAANGHSTRAIGIQVDTTDLPCAAVDSATPPPSLSTTPISVGELRTTTELVNVIASQERSIIDLESKCESLKEQLGLARERNKEQLEQLKSELAQALHDRTVATSSAHSASSAAEEAFGAVSDMYQHVATVASSVRKKRSKRSLRSSKSLSSHPAPPASQVPAADPPGPCPAPLQAESCPSQAPYKPPPLPSNSYTAIATASSSTLSSPWSILETISSPKSAPIQTTAPDPTCKHPPPSSTLSHQLPCTPTSLSPPSPPVSAFARAYWQASATLGLGLAHSKTGPPSLTTIK